MIHPAKYLIDTHALHWHWANPGKLPRKVRDIFARAKSDSGDSGQPAWRGYDHER